MTYQIHVQKNANIEFFETDKLPVGNQFGYWKQFEELKDEYIDPPKYMSFKYVVSVSIICPLMLLIL